MQWLTVGGTYVFLNCFSMEPGVDLGPLFLLNKALNFFDRPMMTDNGFTVVHCLSLFTRSFDKQSDHIKVQPFFSRNIIAFTIKFEIKFSCKVNSTMIKQKTISNEFSK